MKDSNLHISDGECKHYTRRHTAEHATFPACTFFVQSHQQVAHVQ